MLVKNGTAMTLRQLHRIDVFKFKVIIAVVSVLMATQCNDFRRRRETTPVPIFVFVRIGSHSLERLAV